jgi:hypothetical protein
MNPAARSSLYYVAVLRSPILDARTSTFPMQWCANLSIEDRPRSTPGRNRMGRMTRLSIHDDSAIQCMSAQSRTTRHPAASPLFTHEALGRFQVSFKQRARIRHHFLERRISCLPDKRCCSL